MKVNIPSPSKRPKTFYTNDDITGTVLKKKAKKRNKLHFCNGFMIVQYLYCAFIESPLFPAGTFF